MKRFTLIELLVVIAILGILSSILLPALSTARKKSLSALCKSNLKQLYIAKQVYQDDNAEYFMTWPAGNNDGKKKLWYMQFTNTGDDYPYSLSDAELKILECPVIYSLTPGSLTRGTHRNIGMNGFLSGLTSSSINDPVKMVFLGDGYNHHTNDATPSAGFYSWFINGVNRLGGTFDYIHSQKKNLVFVDGHVEPKTRSFCAGNSDQWNPALQ